MQVLDGREARGQTHRAHPDNTVIVLPVKKPTAVDSRRPFLYDLRFTVKNAAGEVIDEVKSYAGMRKVHTQAVTSI